MKCTVNIDQKREEEIIIYTHERSELIDEIEELALSNSVEILGYDDASIIKLSPSEIYCFAIENGKVFAHTNNQTLQIKRRLYELEEVLDLDFIKINQSCIINTKKINRFDASFGGALMVTLKNGYKDYVSRRQLKMVKERIGI